MLETTLQQINIYETLFANIIEDYDSVILKIRVYGTIEKPLFMANDVFKYITGSFLNKTHYLKKFIKPKELVKLSITIIKTSKLDKKFKIIHDCNLLTKYGLMRFVLSRPTDTVLGICFRRFVYALFDKIKNYPKLLEETKIAYHIDMQTPEVQEEIVQAKLPTVSVVYFIKNSRHTKIGYTSNLEQRLSTLQVGSSDELTVYKTIDVPTEDVTRLESYIHKLFTKFHIRGEWYNITNEQIEQLNLCFNEKINIKFGL